MVCCSAVLIILLLIDYFENMYLFGKCLAILLHQNNDKTVTLLVLMQSDYIDTTLH